VSEAMREQIVAGKLAIVKLGQCYEVVAENVAKKISQRDPASVIVDNQQLAGAINVDSKDDPYAEYQIPDDLIW
ncbi:MAG: DUF2058 family protein, partial [Methylococcaceae bacterium]